MHASAGAGKFSTLIGKPLTRSTFQNKPVSDIPVLNITTSNIIIMKELQKGSFEWALSLLKQVKLVKRLCMKNDTIVIEYKSRLYQCSKAAMVRYPYVPTNADLFATDWVEVEPNSAYKKLEFPDDSCATCNGFVYEKDERGVCFDQEKMVFQVDRCIAHSLLQSKKTKLITLENIRYEMEVINYGIVKSVKMPSIGKKYFEVRFTNGKKSCFPNEFKLRVILPKKPIPPPLRQIKDKKN